MKTYEVSFELVHDTPKGARGMSLSMLFESADDFKALTEGVDWAMDRVKVLSEPFRNARLGAVKMHHYAIGTYDAAAHEFGTRRGGMFFEWKCDFPASLDSYVNAFKEKDKK